MIAQRDGPTSARIGRGRFQLSMPVGVPLALWHERLAKEVRPAFKKS